MNKPGNYEVPLGIPFAELLELAGGVRHGHRFKGGIPGGSSMPVLPADIMMDATMDYDVIKAGSRLGSGAVIVMDETTCMVKMLERISEFYMKNLVVNVLLVVKEQVGWRDYYIALNMAKVGTRI